jgi:3-deoxy-D-arabino-heptulosonate 7-phosphate (DAHP) synthase
MCKTYRTENVERAHKSLKMLPVEDQSRYRVMIDPAYADNIDRFRNQIQVVQTVSLQNIPVE